MIRLQGDCPFTLTHDRLVFAVFGDAVNVHLRRADHEVDMVEAHVASSGDKFVVVQLSSSGEGEAVRTSNGDVTGGVLVEERVVEERSAFADGGGSRDKGDFTEAV